MPVVDRYLALLLLRPMGVTLLIALLVLLVERSLRVLNLVLGARGPIRAVFEMMAYLVPHYLGLALPMALFLAVFIAFNRLSRESEIDAFLSAGIGLPRLLRPVAVLTLLLLAAAFAVFAYVQPFARYHYRALVYGISNASIETLLPEGVFTAVDDTTFLIDEISSDRQQFRRVFIFVEEPDGGTSTITAREGSLTRGGPDGPPIVRLFDGVRQSVPAAEGAAQRAPDLGTLRFDELRTALSQGGYRPFRARGQDERELTLIELWQRRDNPPPDSRPAKVVAEFHARVVRALSMLAMPLLAIPLALGRRRTHQSYGLVAGILLLVIYQEVLDFGDNAVADNKVEPWLGLWMPFVVFTGLSLTLFTQAATGVGRPWAMRYFDRAFDWLLLTAGRQADRAQPR